MRDDKMLGGNLCDDIHIQDTSGQIGCYYLIMGYRSSFLGVVRDHFLYAPSQWETIIQCKFISHWLEAFTKWSLCSQAEYNIRWYHIQQNRDRDLALSVISVQTHTRRKQRNCHADDLTTSVGGCLGVLMWDTCHILVKVKSAWLLLIMMT